MYIIYPLFNLKLCYKPSTDSLHPIIPNNACSLRITAAAGTKLADAYSYCTIRSGTKPDVFSSRKEVYNA